MTYSSMNKNAFKSTVEQHFAIFFSAALVPEKVQHACSDLWGEGLLEVIFGCQEIQQTLSKLAARSEALSDVEGVGNGVFIVFQTKAFQAGNNLSARAILCDGVDTEILLVGLPQGVPATVSWIAWDINSTLISEETYCHTTKHRCCCQKILLVILGSHILGKKAGSFKSPQHKKPQRGYSLG